MDDGRTDGHTHTRTHNGDSVTVIVVMPQNDFGINVSIPFINPFLKF